MRRVIDLSTPIVENHFRWPIERKLLKEHGPESSFQGTWIATNCHAFTHMDAPRHFVPDGHTTDGLSLDKVVGEAAVVDIADVGPDNPVTLAHMKAAGGHVEDGDIVLMRAGWDRQESIATPEFWANAPYMTNEAAVWLRERGAKAVGFDFPQDRSIRKFITGEKAERHEHTTHVELLAHGVILMEYLCNMTEIRDARTFVVGLPLKIPDCDGAPARIVAIEED